VPVDRVVASIRGKKVVSAADPGTLLYNHD
jgi:hypothetical protein